MVQTTLNRNGPGKKTIGMYGIELMLQEYHLNGILSDISVESIIIRNCIEALVIVPR